LACALKLAQVLKRGHFVVEKLGVAVARRGQNAGRWGCAVFDALRKSSMVNVKDG
jgi:hypothetical protein